jgi:GT2 family glycosyltransferase
MHFSATIVIPVWNRLEILGECLASLAEHTPADTQIILLDLGSERETERRLEQFAEVLDERVLLMHEPLNRGKTAAINRGIASAAAECVVVISPMTIVTPGWLPPMQNLLCVSSDVGIVCPEILETPLGRRGRSPVENTIEISQGSFYCQAMHKDVFTAIGMFDTGLDGGSWCQSDFSRRAWQAGYKTARCAGSIVYTTPEQVFGSTDRRAKMLEESQRIYFDRWEAPASYCLCLADIAPWWQTIMTGARQGDQFLIVTHAEVSRDIQQAGMAQQHAAIAFAPLPRLLPVRRGKQMITRLLAKHPELQVVTDSESMPLPETATAQAMTDIAAAITARELQLYGR